MSHRPELVRRGCADRNPSRAPLRRFGFALELCPAATAPRPRSGDHDLCPGAAPRRCTPPLGTTTLALGPRPLPWAALRRSAPALGARDAKNRRFWSLAVKTDDFSRYRK